MATKGGPARIKPHDSEGSGKHRHKREKCGPIVIPTVPVISTLIRWEKGSSHLDPHIMLVPHGVTVNEDYTIEVPPAWELDPAWRHRNDMQDIREHNVGVQLSKSKLVKSAADYYQRVGLLVWDKTKFIGSILVIARTALNVYSVINNVVSLPTSYTQNYSTTRHVVFVYELVVVGLLLFAAIWQIIYGNCLGLRARMRAKGQVDPSSGKPFDPAYFVRRQQSTALLKSASYLEKAASFSVLKFLPSFQVLNEALVTKDKAIIVLRERWEELKELKQLYSRTTVLLIAILGIPIWIAIVLGGIVLTVGPYVLSPIALFAKLRFQTPFVVMLEVGKWTAVDWIQLGSLINQIGSAVNLDAVRRGVIFDYVTNGADSEFNMKEFETREEIQIMGFMKLWQKFGWWRSYFLWQLLSSDDMERMTKIDGRPLVFRTVDIDDVANGYEEGGGIVGNNGLVVSPLGKDGEAKGTLDPTVAPSESLQAPLAPKEVLVSP